MVKATNGNKVKFHYIKKLEDGKILDTSKDSQPIEIRIGSKLVPLLENAVKGMEPGEEKTIKVPPENAFGKRREDLIMDVAKNKLPQDIKLTVGKKINIKRTNGTRLNATITGVKGEKVILDANHPLAGESLLFDIKLLEVM
jgi:peptidylprolyl isomerase